VEAHGTGGQLRELRCAPLGKKTRGRGGGAASAAVARMSDCAASGFSSKATLVWGLFNKTSQERCFQFSNPFNLTYAIKN
jgi:hypothetical protein